MKLTSLPLAGGGGRKVYVNPDHVVCVMDMGDNRAQVVTTGLSGESSISLLVSMAPEAVLQELAAGAD